MAAATESHHFHPHSHSHEDVASELQFEDDHHHHDEDSYDHSGNDGHAEEAGMNLDAESNFDGTGLGQDGMQRVQLACTRCRKQKLKCDGTMPACARCQKRGAECVYSKEPTGRKNGSKKKATRREKRKPDEPIGTTGAVVAISNATSHQAPAAARSSPTYATASSAFLGERTPRNSAEALMIATQRPAPQLVALEQLSRKLRMELDSYTTMAKHWQEQLGLLNKGGVSAVTDEGAIRWLKREIRPRAPKVPSGRPRFLPESRTAGESWMSYTSESHPAIHLAQNMIAFSDRSLIANPLASIQDPSQVDLRCHRFRIMRFWNMSSPRELLTDDLSYDTLVAAWDLLLQPISTTIQGNAFVDEIGRPLEDDLDKTRSIDSIALFAHTAELEEVVSVMEFGALFFHATQLVGWDDQLHHLITNVDRLMHVAFFQRGLTNNAELADRAIQFVMWYVWRYKAFKMFTAYRAALNLAYTTMMANLSTLSPEIAGPLNRLLISTSTSIQQMMTHVHLADRLSLNSHSKALLRLAIGVVTLGLLDTQQLHYEQLEAGYPELVSLIESIVNPFDPENMAMLSTALFVHAEVLIRLGRDIRVVESLVDAAVKTVVESQACGAVHLLFSSMFMFQATVNTVVQFSNGTTCTVSDYARIEVAKALGFPLSSCTAPHETMKVDDQCKLKFGDDFMAAISRLGQFQPCDGTCKKQPTNKDPASCAIDGESSPPLVHQCGCALYKDPSEHETGDYKDPSEDASSTTVISTTTTTTTHSTTTVTSSSARRAAVAAAAAAAASMEDQEAISIAVVPDMTTSYGAPNSSEYYRSGSHLTSDEPSEVITPNSEDHTHYHYNGIVSEHQSPLGPSDASSSSCCGSGGNCNCTPQQQQQRRASSSSLWTSDSSSVSTPHSARTSYESPEYGHNPHTSRSDTTSISNSTASVQYQQETPSDSATTLSYSGTQSSMSGSIDSYFPVVSETLEEYSYTLTMSGDAMAWATVMPPTDEFLL